MDINNVRTTLTSSALQQATNDPTHDVPETTN